MTQRDTPESENSFARLLDQARAGSREALGEVLKAFEYVLEKKARRFHRSGALRSKWGDSDLVQSTFLDAQRSFRQFRGRTDSTSSICLALRNRIRLLWKKLNRKSLRPSSRSASVT